MQFNITGTNLKITKGIRDYVNKKITKVINDFEHPVNCNVILKVEKNRHIAEVILSGDSGRFYLKKTENDLYKSIDSVVQSADIKVKKFKDKQKDHKMRNKNIIHKRTFYREVNIKKIKVEDLKPMSIEEAILQLKYIRQNILIFQNAKNFNAYVLFKNKRTFNLIQPKISFLPKFLFPKSKRSKYNSLSLTYNNKIKKIKRKKVILKTMPYKEAFAEIVNNRNLGYLIFENFDTEKMNIFFRINKNLIGNYEF